MFNPSMSKVFSERTYLLKEQTWWESFAENLPLIREEPCVTRLEKQITPAVVIGAGPSVDSSKLEKLKEFSGRIFVSDRMLSTVLDIGLDPFAAASLDGDPSVASFYKQPSVTEYVNGLNICLATYVHPSVVEACNGFKRFWFNVMFDNPETAEVSLSRAMFWMTKGRILSNGFGNVGGWLFSLANELESTPIILLGIDMSYGADVAPMQTTYWRGLLERYKGDKKKVIKECYRYETNPFGRRVLTDTVFSSYRDTLLKGIEATKAKVWNCSPNSIVYGKGVECMTLDEALRGSDNGIGY